MELGIKKYAFRMFVCMALMAVLILGAAYLWFPEAFSWKVVVLAAAFYVVSIFGILMLDHFAKKGDRTLVSGYMAVKGIRMVVLVLVLLVFLIIDRASAKWMAASFILLYLAMLIFDTIYFSRKFKK